MQRIINEYTTSESAKFLLGKLLKQNSLSGWNLYWNVGEILELRHFLEVSIKEKTNIQEETKYKGLNYYSDLLRRK